MSTEVETAAREMGWRPKEEFRGDPEKWVDADTFVSRGENFLPIIKKDRDTLRAKTAELESQVRETRSLLAASQEAIAELKKFHTESTAKQVEKAKKDLIAQLKVAREAGDVAQEVAIQDEIDDLRQAQKAAETVEVKPQPAPSPAPAGGAASNPAYQEWESRNPWFRENARRRGLALGIAQELRESPATKHLVGKEFFDKLDEELERETGGRQTGKVDGGRPSGGSRGASTERTYADLPAEAKAACDQQAHRLVGPGRAFKDDAAWRAYYAKEYFQGDDA